MSLKEEITGWMDTDGLVTPRPCTGGHNGSGNGVLYTSLYVLLLQRRHEATAEDLIRFREVIKACELAPGLYKRGPYHPDQEAMDDYTALLLASQETGLPEISRRVLKYGRSTFPPYLYNNVDPGKFSFSAWLGRMPQLVAHLQWCAGENPALWKRIYTALVIAISGKPGDQDSWLFSWCVKESSKQSALCRLAGKRWEKRLKATWGENPMQKILSAALSPEHPVAKYWI